MGGQVSKTFTLHIRCKKGAGEGIQITCKIAYVLNGRPPGEMILGLISVLSLSICKDKVSSFNSNS